MEEKFNKICNLKLDEILSNEIKELVKKSKDFKRMTIYNYLVKGFYLFELRNNDIGIDIGITINFKESELKQGMSLIPQTFIINGIIKVKHNKDLKLTILGIKKVPNLITSRFKNSLVPFIKKNQFEDIATKILRYAYPEALEGKPLDIGKFVKKFNLNIRIFNELEPNIMGRIYFEDITHTIEGHDGSKHSIEVKKNTLMINSILLEDIGSFNFTVMHECVHYLLHRRSFLLYCIISNKAKMYQCLQDEKGIIRPSIKEFKAMEWQANYLAPKLLMPHEALRALVDNRLAYIKNNLAHGNLVDYYEPLMDQLASYYKVKSLAVKLRLLELGYTFPLGCYIYVDNKKIPAHEWAGYVNKDNYTFCISLEDSMAYTNTFRGQDFLKAFIYVDSHFVLNHPKYIERKDDSLHLSIYAREHMHKCCIRFIIDLISTAEPCDRDYKSYRILNRTMENKSKLIVKGIEDRSIALIGLDQEALEEAMHDSIELESKMTQAPSECLLTIKKYYNYSIDHIVDASGLSRQTVERYLYNAIHIKRNTLIKLLLSINVPGNVIIHVLDVSGFHLSPGIPKDAILKFTITYGWKNSLEENIKFLKEHDIFL